MAKQIGIYRPRSPQNVPFYQCIADHFEEFIQAYDKRYEREYGFWRPVIVEVIEKFLKCGDLNHGFARVHCDHCGHEYLLAFSPIVTNLKQVCSQFGFTRESYRHILERFHSEGIGGLFERKRGRQRPVKAKEQIQDYIRSEHFRDKSLTADQLAQHCYQEFGVSISRRTVFRILEKHRRHKKKSHPEIW